MEAQRRFSVLIVDDSTYNLFVMREILTQIEGGTMILEQALNGQEAIERVKECHSRRI